MNGQFVGMVFVFAGTWILRACLGWMLTSCNSEECDSTKARLRNVTLSEYSRDIVWVVPFVYTCGMVVVYFIECVMSRILLGSWFLFFNWWSVSLCLFPLVYAAWYSRRLLAVDVKGESKLLQSIYDESVSVAYKVFDKNDDVRLYKKYADDKAEENKKKLISSDAYVPSWMDIKIHRVAMASYGVLTVLCIAKMLICC